MESNKRKEYEQILTDKNSYIIIQNKWHRGRLWKFKFTLAARPLLIIP
jgi:hypothetical protein